MNFLDEAQSIKGKLVEWRRHLHMYPEVSGKEFNTATFIAKQLTAIGIEVTTNVGCPLPGVVGLLKGGHPGKTVALRADMDALGIHEKNDTIYKSKNDGIMHACGHDAHMAILLGTAELLAKAKDELKGNVKFIFQPSEEIYGGAIPMIDAGALENPTVDAIFGLHMDPTFKTGEIGIHYGETLAASDRIIVKIKGKSAHGANPNESVDSMVVAAHLILALQAVISRQKDPLSPGVLSFGMIQGGQLQNVIPDEVLLKGILRTLNPEVRESCIANIERIVKGISQSFNANGEFIREKSYDSLINHDEYVDFIKATASSIFSPDAVKKLNQPRLIVEDFAYFLQHKPGAFYFLGCGKPDKNTNHPLHSSSFDIDEQSLVNGAALQTALVVNFLK